MTFSPYTRKYCASFIVLYIVFGQRILGNHFHWRSDKKWMRNFNKIWSITTDCLSVSSAVLSGSPHFFREFDQIEQIKRQMNWIMKFFVLLWRTMNALSPPRITHYISTATKMLSLLWFNLKWQFTVNCGWKFPWNFAWNFVALILFLNFVTNVPVCALCMHACMWSNDCTTQTKKLRQLFIETHDNVREDMKWEKKRKGDAKDCMSRCLIEVLTRCLTNSNNCKWNY